MKIEKVTPREHLCKVGDFIYSNDSDVLYMITETTEGYLLLNMKSAKENNRASNIPDLLEFMRKTDKAIIPSDDATIILKSNNW